MVSHTVAAAWDGPRDDGPPTAARISTPIKAGAQWLAHPTARPQQHSSTLATRTMWELNSGSPCSLKYFSSASSMPAHHNHARTAMSCTQPPPDARVESERTHAQTGSRPASIAPPMADTSQTQTGCTRPSTIQTPPTAPPLAPCPRKDPRPTTYRPATAAASSRNDPSATPPARHSARPWRARGGRPPQSRGRQPFGPRWTCPCQRKRRRPRWRTGS